MATQLANPRQTRKSLVVVVGAVLVVITVLLSGAHFLRLDELLAIPQRHHNLLVKGSVTATVASITDASPWNRYTVLVPDGVHPNEAIITKNYVDIVCASPRAVLTSSSTSADTVHFTGSDTTIANCTIDHVLKASDPHRYPIHMDSPGSGWFRVLKIPTRMVLLNVTANALGTYRSTLDAPYGAIGIGIYGYQSIDLIGVTANGGNLPGILAHNQLKQSSPSHLRLVDSNGSSNVSWGLTWANVGSGQPDDVELIGGSYSGPMGDVYSRNLMAGADEAQVKVGSGMR